MRWFDRQGLQREAARADYWRHVEELRPQLPEAVRRLALDINLHDAKIAQWETNEGVLRAGFKWGDLQVGYWLSTLTYEAAQVRLAAGEAHWLDDPEIEVLYDEVDVGDDGRFEHRLLFWPRGEIAIRFRSLALETEPLQELDYQRDVPTVFAGSALLEDESVTEWDWPDDLPGLVRAAALGDRDLVAELLQSGIEPNEADEFGYTALRAAAQFDHPEIVTLLLDGGAVVDARDEYGSTPLLGACNAGAVVGTA